MAASTDRIEKTVLLRAPLARVWRAVSDAKEFGTWFGVEFDGPFVAGARVTGRIVPTKVDPEVAKMQQPYAGMPFELEEAAGATKLVITESGFDRIPLERRAKAFTANEQGWAAQARLIEKYVTGQGRS